MGYPEIVRKLATIIEDKAPLTEECHVVYLLVEVRKILDHKDSNKKYPLLKFYADWCVHTSKDRISPEIQEIMSRMYESAIGQIENPGDGKVASPAMQFAYMEDLASDFEKFLEDHHLPTTLVREEGMWLSFVQLLVRVLQDQPIVEPVQNVQRFFFEPAAEGCVVGVMIFKEPVSDNHYYRFMNSY